MVFVVDDDDRRAIDANDRRPSTYQPCVVMARPEVRGRRRTAFVFEDVPQPIEVWRLQAVLHVLLPLRRQDLCQRSQRHDDMHPVAAELVNDPPDRLAVRSREPLAADDEAAVRGVLRLATQRLPVLFLRRRVTAAAMSAGGI